MLLVSNQSHFMLQQQQNSILHKQTNRKVLLCGGHMAHFVSSSVTPKHKLQNDNIYIYINLYIYIYTHTHVYILIHVHSFA